MKKSSLTAFFLGLIPGMGHMYLRKFVRGFLYPFAVLLTFMMGVMMAFVVGDDEPFFFGLVIAAIIYFVSIVDLIITLLNMQNVFVSSAGTNADSDSGKGNGSNSTEATSGATIALAFIPGLGHMHMGLVYRGLTFLISFFGILTMVFFVTAIMRMEQFLIFLGVLPILWVYNLFDAMQLYHRKSRGETLVDRTIFEELEEQRESGKKSKVLAMVLSFLPGAGHMYLGLQKRGLQLMAAFLFSIYILDVLRLSFFLFLIPIIWFFSFFDALQQLSRYEQGTAKDTPVVDWLLNHQKWIGIGLLALGLFYLLDRVGLPLLYVVFPNIQYGLWIDKYFQTTVISLVLIIGGIKLLSGSKRKGGGEQ